MTATLLQALTETGLRKTDPRLMELRSNLMEVHTTMDDPRHSPPSSVSLDKAAFKRYECDSKHLHTCHCPPAQPWGFNLWRHVFGWRVPEVCIACTVLNLFTNGVFNGVCEDSNDSHFALLCWVEAGVHPSVWPLLVVVLYISCEVYRGLIIADMRTLCCPQEGKLTKPQCMSLHRLPTRFLLSDSYHMYYYCF